MKFSIITICYNNKDGLKKTIESVISQTYNDYEYIIIDGGSTDGSKELIEQYQKHLTFWCSEPDKGIYNAMNKGVKHANGDYINFMNSGDYFHNNNVLADVAKLKPNADIFFGKVLRTDNGGPLFENNPKLLLQLLWCGYGHQGTFNRRYLFEKHPFDENLKIVADWKFWWDTLVFDNYTFQMSELIIADYEIGGISSSPQNMALQMKEREDTLNSYFPKLVLKELNNYLNLRQSFLFTRIKYLKDYHHCVFVIIRKIITLTYLVCHKFSKKNLDLFR